jgi:ribosomal-protein-alanine N-acetyltransferase
MSGIQAVNNPRTSRGTTFVVRLTMDYYNMNSTENSSIRKADLSDLDTLVAFENHCFTQDLMSRKSFYELLKKNSSDILIAEINNQIAGSATLFFRKNSTVARVYSIAVDTQYHGKGVAVELYTALENAAIKRGCTEIMLEVRIDNPRAIHFYKKHHYETFATYTKFYEDGTDALRMKKILTSKEQK